jgi:hypothetical protein
MTKRRLNMNSALKTIKKALEVLPSNVLLEAIDCEWYYDEEGDSEVYWEWEDGGWNYSGRITEGYTEMYGLFMCNVDIQTGTWMSFVFSQDKRLMDNPEEDLT